MKDYVIEGSKLYHKYLSNVTVTEVCENGIKASTSKNGILEFGYYNFGKVLFFDKEHSYKEFESEISYLEFYVTDKERVIDEKGLNQGNLDESLVDFFEILDEKKFYDNDNNKLELPKEFIISKNNFLQRNIVGYYHQFYTGYRKPGNPDFINTLKNTFNSTPLDDLIKARDKVSAILIKDIPEIMRKENLKNCLCVCIPRAKAEISYTNQQLMFKEAVKIAVNKIQGVTDGTDFIIRETDTLTTHLWEAAKLGKVENEGDKPYLGITNKTCKIDGRIKDQNIILVDDIYTKNVNIDEDCIQALLDKGAKKIIFYSIGYSRRL